MTKDRAQSIEIETEVTIEPNLRPISWGVARRLGMLNTQLTATQKRLNVLAEGMDADKLAEAMDQMNNIMDAIESEIAKLVISVPRDWLCPDAPEAIDWMAPSALQQYLLADKFALLIQIAAGGLQREAGKN